MVQKGKTVKWCIWGFLLLSFLILFQETLTAGEYETIDNRSSVESYAYGQSGIGGAFRKKLKSCDYGFLENVAIPGMPATKNKDVYSGKIPDSSLCPQGICLTAEYMFVSAYSTDYSENLGCIYVFDRETGAYTATLGMKSDSHLGGITFDGENLWVCHSNTNTLECIPSTFVQRIAQKKPKQMVDCSRLFTCYTVKNQPSCITFYKGKLWVATHKKVNTSVLCVYEIKNAALECVNAYTIPSKVQGVAFDEMGQVYLSCSYGRTKSSYLKVYTSVELLHQKPEMPKVQIEMPPCAEELVLTEEEVYVLFESAGEKYYEGTDGRGRSTAPIQNILTISKKSILD